MSKDQRISGTVDVSPKGRVRLRRRYKAFVVKDEGLFLFSDRDYQVFEGQIFVDLFPFLKGGFDEAAIADALEGAYPRSIVHYALGLLTEHHVVTSAPRNGPLREEAFWDDLNLDAQSVRKSLAAATIGVTGVGAVKVTPVIQALRSLGLRARMVKEPKEESFHVAVVDDYLAPQLAKLAAINLRDDRPWLLVRGTGTELWIGPLFKKSLGCFECLAWRMRTNHTLERYVARRLGRKRGVTRAIAHIAPVSGLVANIVALEVAKWVAGYPDTAPHVKTIDLRTFHVVEHALKRRPQCRFCGDPQLQTEILIQPVRVNKDEQPAWTTLNDISGFVSKVNGIVTELVPAATGLASLHAYNGFFGFARDVADFQAFKKSFLSQAAGVGRTAEDAKIGAICEALERYSGMYHGDEPAIQASYAQLDPARTVHPNACMLYSTRQFDLRDKINAEGAAFDFVPKPFDETAVLDWTGVWSLSSRRFKLVPSTYLFYSHPQPPGGPFCLADSNGCATGKTLTDAILRGLFELVERDSVAIWWYNRLRRPSVDLSSFQSEYFDRFVQSYASLQREAWVLDITSDLQIPTFVAISRSTFGKPEDILVSFGAHLNPRLAIEHALSEMNHLLPAVLPENRTSSGDYPYPDPSHKRWWRTATAENEPYLVPDSKMPARGATEYAVLPTHSEAEQAAMVCETLQRHGLEVLVLNQTRPDLNIPVARVIVPGLRHFWARLGPGRLYDVPVTMGWLDKSRSEEELNPIAMFV
ncbi:MAG TPA: TOMM precursor leader peptide-binding protein [Candidatus Acidoferrum sp.]|jgi:bacteriocin biosynthesis cyclodehydratase domain-containing protein|nr:TOMM precursor leader peptide-binding protein [Candidatus Acidoferrum sp.]